jgi:hypothetical protein
MDRRIGGIAPFAIVAAALYYAYGVIARNADAAVGAASTDIYAYTVPNFRYAAEAISRGDGVLWNALQNCGQPFFGLSSSGLLYPPNALYALGDTPSALLLSVVFHLVVAGTGAYQLSRALGLGPIGALCGSLAFQLGSSCLALASWNPALLAPYAWLPWCMWMIERLLVRPGPGPAVGLGAVLALQIFAGFPQTVFLSGQLVALRVVWEFVVRRRRIDRSLASALVIAVALPGLLGAAQLLPAAETAAASLRAEGLPAADHGSSGETAWNTFREQFALRSVGYGNLFTATGALLIGFAFRSASTRSLVCFYLAAGALHFVLAFWAPLYELYASAPIVRAFRQPSRLLWVTSFAASVLVGMGADGVAKLRSGEPKVWRLCTGPLLAFTAFALLAPDGLRRTEIAMVAVALPLAVAGTVVGGRWLDLARVAIPVLLVINLVSVSAHSYLRNLGDLTPLFAERDAFASLRERMTPHDRVLTLGPPADFSVMPKSASLFGVASLSDYEPLASGRYARLFVRLYGDQKLVRTRQFIFPRLGPQLNRPLLNLTAGRYLLAKGNRALEVVRRARPRLPVALELGDTLVFRNPRALPRAYYVPRVEMIPDAEALLARLASDDHQPLEVALIESPTSEGFSGKRTTGKGVVQFVADQSESVSLAVDATDSGFVVLTDQYYPGWSARVNGEPARIERANFAFRLVRVPQGRSRVDFVYEPLSVSVGLAISSVSWTAVLGYGAWSVRRRLR